MKEALLQVLTYKQFSMAVTFMLEIYQLDGPCTMYKYVNN